MKLISLPTQTRNALHATHKVILNATSDLTSTGSAQTIQVYPSGTDTFAAGTTVRFAGMNLVTVFDAAGLNNLVIQLGDANDPDRFLTGTELASAGTEVLYKVEGATTQPFAYASADGLDVKFSAAFSATGVSTLGSVDTGQVEIYFEVSNIDELERAQ